MNKTKRILTLFLALGMLLSLFVGSAWAEKNNSEILLQSVETMTVENEHGRVHNLVIRGAIDSKAGFARMRDVLRDNILPEYTNDGTVTTLEFEEGKNTGITKDDLFAKFRLAFGRSNDNDLNILYYAGHSMLCDGEPEEIQMCLHFRDKSFSDVGIPPSEIFEELEKYKGDYVIILDTCYAGGYDFYGLDTLEKDKQKRYRMILAQDEEHPTYRASYLYTESLGVLTNAILKGIGYYKDYKTMDADSDDDGCVSLEELDNYFESERFPVSLRWDPGVYGRLGLRLFHFTKIRSIKEGSSNTKDIESEQIVGTKKLISAELGRDSGGYHQVIWNTSNPSIATVEDSNGKSAVISFLSEGKVTISAVLQDEEGNQFMGSGRAVSLNVKKPSITVAPTTLKLYEKENKSITATVKGTTIKPKWKSSDEETATVNSNGKVTAKKAGSCIISAYLGDSEAGCMINVKKPTIKLNKSSLSLDLEKKKTETLKATVDGPSKKVTWKSSNTKIATVDKNGKVTAKKDGKCTITATANGVATNCKVEVLVPKEKYYPLYAKIVKEREKTYGKAEVGVIPGYGPTAKGLAGVSVVKLLDMDGNGYDEMILVYKKKNVSETWWVDIWTFDGKKAVVLSKKKSASSFGDSYYTLVLAKSNSRWNYVVGYESAYDEKWQVYQVDKTKMNQVQMIKYVDDWRNGDSYYINNTIASEKEYNKARNSLKSSTKKTQLFSGYKTSTIKETNATRKKLGLK